MKRIKNIDLLRAGAILYIMLYHCYVLSGQPWQAHTAIHTILTLGGEVGVTLFFLLSGYGIYLSLSSSEERGCLPGWRAFMKKRCIRIMPQYYVCVTVLLIFMSTQMFSNEGFRHILAYYTFTENFSPVTHGSINGALWTMGVIFQFYLIAPFLYKAVRKNWLVSAIVSILFTVICRFAVVRYLHASGISDTSVYFVYERQVFTALDNFVLGMAAAAFWKHAGNRIQEKRLTLGLPVSLASTILILAWIFYYHSHGLYGTAPTGYPAHSILAVLLGILLVGFSILPEMNFGILRPVLRGAKPIRNLPVAYACHYDPSGQCSMVQHHEPAALLAVFAMYDRDHLRIRIFCNPFHRPSGCFKKERIITYERQNCRQSQDPQTFQ